MDTGRKIRFGIMVDALTLSIWQLNCIKQLIALDNVELCTVVIHRPNQKEDTVTQKTGLFRFYQAIRKNRYQAKRDLLEQVDDAVTIITLYSKRGFHNDLQSIEQQNLDFILDFGNEEVSEKLLNIPQYGVWRFHFGELESYGEILPGFWEVFNRESVTKVYLEQVHTTVQRRYVLKEATFATKKSSYLKNSSSLYSAVETWAAAVCLSIFAGEFQKKAIELKHPLKLSKKPTNDQFLQYLNTALVTKVRKVYDKLFRYEYWNVGVVDQPIHSFINQSEVNIKWLFNKSDHYYADPFGYRYKDEYHLMVEELDEKEPAGYLTRITLDGGKLANVEPSVVKLQTHMSYPFILEFEGETYCIPETSEKREVAIYRLDRKTDEWVKVKVLLQDFPAIDSTIINHDDKWWLFCTNGDRGSLSDLYIFYCDDLFGNWYPHLLNPVKQDVRSSRPAGTIFKSNGKLYRPAQDCSETYGGRIGINLIKKLTTTFYQEELCTYINPQENSLYPDGTHTISSVGDKTVFDGKRIDYAYSNLFKKLFVIKYRFRKNVLEWWTKNSKGKAFIVRRKMS